jgi:hypothetical protein
MAELMAFQRLRSHAKQMARAATTLSPLRLAAGRRTPAVGEQKLAIFGCASEFFVVGTSGRHWISTWLSLAQAR